MRKNARFFRREKSWLWAAGLLCLGLTLRLLFLEKLPYGLNQDEASAGYDAWALLQAGIDRNGKSWPVLFFSWGSGQNVLMSYLAIPFIALWGLRPLSLRLPNAIAGCVTLWGMWRFARKVRGEKFGLWALGLLAINPWHIMASRWGLESNLLPALLMGACFFLSRAEEKPKALFGAALCLGLAPYAYGTAFFFLPPFLLWSVIRLRKSLRPGVTVLSFLLFSLLIFPIAYCQALNILGGEEKRLLGMTLPRLVDARQNATSILGGGGLGVVRKNVLTFLEILHNGDDQVEYNALPFWQGGILYFFGLPLAVLGVIRSIQERGKRPGEWPMLGWLGCAALCSALIDGNINRLNMVWIPMIYYSALGGFWLMDQLQLRRALPLAVAVLSFLYFGYNYSTRFAAPGHYKYFPGLGEAISRAEELSPETVYITSQVRQPYIFALFYTTPAPERFAESAVFQTDLETGMQTVERMEGFEFAEIERADLWILTEGEAQEQQREILDTFGLYAVCR